MTTTRRWRTARQDGTDIPGSLEQVRAWLHDTFGTSPDLVMREIRLGSSRRLAALVAYIDSLADAVAIGQLLIDPLIRPSLVPVTRTNAVGVLREKLVNVARVAVIRERDRAIGALLSGEALVFVDGVETVLACDVGQLPKRNIEEPATEVVAVGPREGFNEHIEDMISLLRRRIRSPKLRLELFTIGRYSHTRVVLTYIEGLVDPAVLEEARARLRRIGDRIDGVFVHETLSELIEDHRLALFPTVNITERPERVGAALLQGRFAIFIDGTPFAITAPAVFGEFLSSAADHGERAWMAGFLRIIRVASLFGSLFLPSLYVALVSFHQEMLPTALLLSVATGRERVPLPAVGEALLMEGAFEVLREAGLRLPRAVGGAISIVGVLVIGQAAVAAGIVSPLMIIVVGATAIASFAIPNYQAANILRLLRFPIVIMAGAFGAVGILFCFILLTLHIMSLRSFGTPYLYPVAPFSLKDVPSAFLRLPRWMVPHRFTTAVQDDRRRQDPGLRPRPKEKD